MTPPEVRFRFNFESTHFRQDCLLAGKEVDTNKVKIANENGATIVNLSRAATLLSCELTLEALEALRRWRKPHSKGKNYERAVSSFELETINFIARGSNPQAGKQTVEDSAEAHIGPVTSTSFFQLLVEFSFT